MQNVRVVFISVPADEAGSMARQMVDHRLCACVNIVPKIESYFWWEGEVQHDREALLIVKTTQQRLDELVQWVQDNHPYDLPEVIAVPVEDGLKDYLNWVGAEVKP